MYHFQISCQTPELNSYPDSDWCRVLSLSDGTVINQGPVHKVLCTAQAVRTTRLKISKDYMDGEGIYLYFMALHLTFVKK